MLSPPDPFSMIAMALPTILLYEAAIYAVARVEKSREARERGPGGGLGLAVQRALTKVRVHWTQSRTGA